MNYLLTLAIQIAKKKYLPLDNILKALMHYDILSVLASCKVAFQLILQGGTAIRLGYGGQRLLENLDCVWGATSLDLTALDTFARKLKQRFKQA